jgi:putative heme iron utilization protein
MAISFCTLRDIQATCVPNSGSSQSSADQMVTHDNEFFVYRSHTQQSKEQIVTALAW